MFRRFLFPLLVLCLPIAGFVLLMWDSVAGLAAGGTSGFIIKLLAGLAVLALIEVPLLRFWILPQWTQSIGERLYGGAYTPGQDAVVSFAEKVRETKDASLLPELERLVRADAARMRGWRELADVQQYIFERPADALQTLLEAAKRVRDKEERAMLLYRAAHLAESALNQADEAARLYGEAARRFPRTVYGRKAATHQS